jgi:hypothetical protein
MVNGGKITLKIILISVLVSVIAGVIIEYIKINHLTNNKP